MSIEQRKAKESARLRQKILNAALRVFAEQGYDRVSMRKIAALIDYSPTTIYRFFKSKEELLQVLAATTYKDMAGAFEKVKKKGKNDPLGTLKSLIREYVIFCVERPDMFRLYSDISIFEMEEGAMYERLGETRYRVYQSWFSCIRQSIESNLLAIQDDERVFLYLWDAVNGYIDHRIRFTGVARKPLEDDVELYMGLVFRGVEVL